MKNYYDGSWEDPCPGDWSNTIAADAWRKRWPDHCPACRGWGQGAPTYEMHGFTHGPAECLPGDPCEELPEGTCHRCGHSGPGDEGEHELDDGTHPCPACGWNWDDGEPG